MEQNSVFVRKSTGLVREASFLDAAIFTACFSAPVGATLAFGLFWALGAFPGTNIVLATFLAAVLDVPILIMMAYMASSMPRTGGDYIWVSRILSPPVALVSNFAAALSALIGAAYWARIWGPMAVGPSLVILGNVLGIKEIADVGKTAGNSTWTFILGFVMILVLVITLGTGTKMMFKIQNFCFAIAMTGTLLAFIVFLIGDKSTFVQNFNSFAFQYTNDTDSYNFIINTAKEAGLSTSGKTTLGATIPTIVCIMTFMMWNFWSVYLSGEMKGAGQRKRQLSIMLSALVWDTGFIILGALLIYKVVGADFLQSINFLSGTDKYTLPASPYFNLFAGMLMNNPLLNVLIGVSFMFWNLPAMVGNTFMPIRTLFAWSFDRVLPQKLSEINEKTHSPIPAIIVVAIMVVGIFTWSILSTSFFTLLSLGVLCGVIVISIVAVAAIVMPYRRADLYKTSPANVSFCGVPVLVITGVLSLLVMSFITYLLMAYPAIGIRSPLYVIVFIVSVVVVGLLIFYISRAIQKSKGIDLDLSYKELPPE